MMAIADVFDALITPRVYKPAMSYAAACAFIAAGRGSHFDPDMADVFIAEAEGFIAIAERYRDTATAP